MKQVDDFFAVPYLTINKHFEILTQSEELDEICKNRGNFLEMLDEASISKVQKEVIPSKSKNKLEIFLITREGERLLIDLYVKWTHDFQAEIMLIAKDRQLLSVTDSLAKLRTRLNSTNFELLREKEKLQEAIQQNYLLSAPFIRLSDDTAIVPLFGLMDKDKMDAVNLAIHESAQQEDVDTILFDFTGVGDLTREGILSFGHIARSLTLMGIEIIIIGVHPHQARKMKELEINLPLQFISSLQHAISLYIKQVAN